VPWTDIEQVDFDRVPAMYPPPGGALVQRRVALLEVPAVWQVEGWVVQGRRTTAARSK
jgi:hypothetical protein